MILIALAAGDEVSCESRRDWKTESLVKRGRLSFLRRARTADRIVIYSLYLHHSDLIRHLILSSFPQLHCERLP